jgi:homoserine O-acetyltransferase/O-succinyltransferase
MPSRCDGARRRAGAWHWSQPVETRQVTIPRFDIDATLDSSAFRRGELWWRTPFVLHSGGTLAELRMAWHASGPVDAPIVLALGGISAHRAAEDHDGTNGWWREQCGPGFALDTRRFRVLGVDWLGGSHDSTGPAGDATFPEIDTRDQARAIVLLLDALGIARVRLLVGASYGGCVAQHLAVLLGDRVERVAIVCAAHRATRFASGLRYVQREVLKLGGAHGCDRAALAVARSLAMLTYRTPGEFEERFDGPGEVASYLRHHGERYGARHDPVAVARLSASLDAHDFDPRELRAPTTLIGFDSDQLVPPWLLREFAASCPHAQTVLLGSRFGHDAFLKEEDAMARELRRQLRAGGAA